MLKSNVREAPVPANRPCLPAFGGPMAWRLWRGLTWQSHLTQKSLEVIVYWGYLFPLEWLK